EAERDAVQRLVEVVPADYLLVAARRYECGLVREVLEVGAGEHGRGLGQAPEAYLVGDGLVAHVHLEDLLAFALRRQADRHLPVETAGAQEGRVQDVWPVRGRDDDDRRVLLEPVHLGEYLVERLLALVVTPT